MKIRTAKKIIKAVNEGDVRHHPHQVTKAQTVTDRWIRRNSKVK